MRATRRRMLAGLTGLIGTSVLAPLRAKGDEIIRINIPGPHLMPFYPLELIPLLGLDREVGARLAVRYLPSGVVCAEDMLAGNADFAAVGFPVLPNFIARNKEIRAFVVLSSGAPPYGILVHKKLAPRIRTIRDLRGHSLGVALGSASTKTYLHLLAELWLASHGVPSQEVRWIPITQNYEGASGALAGNIADAVFCEEPIVSTLVRKGLGVQIASLSDRSSFVDLAGRDHIRSVVTASPSTLANRPESTRKLVQMMKWALQWVHDTPLEQIPQKLGILDVEQHADIVNALKRLPNFYSRDGRFLPREVDATREFMQAVGLLMRDGSDITRLIDERWVR